MWRFTLYSWSYIRSLFKKNLLEGESQFMKSLEDLKKLHEEAAKKLALRHQKEGYKVYNLS